MTATLSFLSLVPHFFAQAAGGSGTQQPSPFFSLPYLIFLAVIFFFVVIRPQQKRSKEQAALVSALKTGDKVVTSGGFHGMIANVREQTVIVKFAENVKIEVDKSSVVSVAKDGADSDAKTVSVS